MLRKLLVLSALAGAGPLRAARVIELGFPCCTVG